MSKIVLATGNPGKVKEMADLLSEFGFTVIPQSEFNLDDVEETGTTFVENAIIKARYAAQYTGFPAIADDSGLEVDALQGEPGVYSARYAGGTSTDRAINDRLNNEKLLAELAKNPECDRTARFHCVLVMMRHAKDPTPLICQGVWQGTIGFEAQGEAGFGYDPLFICPEFNCSAALLTKEQKHVLSHRGKALQQFFQSINAIDYKIK